MFLGVNEIPPEGNWMFMVQIVSKGTTYMRGRLVNGRMIQQ